MNLLLKGLERIPLNSTLDTLDIRTNNISDRLYNSSKVIYYVLHGESLHRYLPYHYKLMGGITLYRGNYSSQLLDNYKIPLYITHPVPNIFSRIDHSLVNFIYNHLLTPYFTKFHINDTPYLIGNSVIINEIRTKAILSILYDTKSIVSNIVNDKTFNWDSKPVLGLSISDNNYPLEAYLKKNINEFIVSNSFESVIRLNMYITEYNVPNIDYREIHKTILLNTFLNKAFTYIDNYYKLTEIYDRTEYENNRSLTKSIKQYLLNLIEEYKIRGQNFNEIIPISLEESKEYG